MDYSLLIGYHEVQTGENLETFKNRRGTQKKKKLMNIKASYLLTGDIFTFWELLTFCKLMELEKELKEL
jgi:hypothetical protein